MCCAALSDSSPEESGFLPLQVGKRLSEPPRLEQQRSQNPDVGVVPDARGLCSGVPWPGRLGKRPAASTAGHPAICPPWERPLRAPAVTRAQLRFCGVCGRRLPPRGGGCGELLKRSPPRTSSGCAHARQGAPGGPGLRRGQRQAGRPQGRGLSARGEAGVGRGTGGRGPPGPERDGVRGRRPSGLILKRHRSLLTLPLGRLLIKKVTKTFFQSCPGSVQGVF